MTSQLLELQIDGLIGPTHHFGGLGVGNLASQANQYRVSNPKAAALEGLSKMRLLWSLGIPQFYLPPPTRPNWSWLKSLGFHGSHSDMLKQCYDRSTHLLSAAYSSAFMWTANAATVAPDTDTRDAKLRIVPANLGSSLHRGQEAHERGEQLSYLFASHPQAEICDPLPSVFPLRDEGAANHMRLCNHDGMHGIHVFVSGPEAEKGGMRFLGRQSEMASRQIACALKLPAEDCFFLQQTPEAIDAGVFHNDVIAMSNTHQLFYHEKAFVNSDRILEKIASRFLAKTGIELKTVCVSEHILSLAETVQSYLFNSQLVRTADDRFHLICPSQCKESAEVNRVIQSWIDDSSIQLDEVHFVSLNQSMANGGGPACLRLRVPIRKAQIALLSDKYEIDSRRLETLQSLIEQWYPDRVSLTDFVRLDFAEHVIAATEAF